MDLGIKGKVALITGGSMGIGGATARLLAKEGVTVAITARREKELTDAAKQIGSETGSEITWVNPVGRLFQLTLILRGFAFSAFARPSS